MTTVESVEAAIRRRIRQTAVLAEGRPIRRLSLLDEKGRTLQTTDHEYLSKRFGHTSAMVLHRGDLQRVLLAHVKPSNLHTAHRCESVQQNGDTLTLNFADGRKVEADIVLGCDGIHSAIRKALIPEPRERFAAYTCWRGITMKPAEMDETHVTESWGRGRRFGLAALRLADGVTSRITNA